MAPPVFAPSSFWVFARRALSWRFLVSLVIIAGTFEVVARVSPWIVGRVVHQQYLVSQRICELDCTNQGQRITWSANERGARGDLYHGQTLRIAALGSSTTASSMLDQEQTWPERLKAELGPSRVHVDNYAREGATFREATRKLPAEYQL